MKSGKSRKRKRPIVQIMGLCLFGILLPLFIIYSPGIVQSIQRIIAPPEIWQVRTYTKHILCGHEQIGRQEKIRSNNSKNTFFLNVTGGDHRRNSSFQVQAKDHLIIYRIKKEDWCNSCRRNRFIGIKGQNVVVLRGTPFQPGPVQEIVKINIRKLPESERNDLIHGIPYKDEKEKLQVIEGLSELMSE